MYREVIMANLIPKEEISELKPASDVRSTALEASKIHEKESVARLINLAANTGELRAIWEHPLSDDLKSELESQGYHVSKKTVAANPNFMYIIEWN